MPKLWGRGGNVNSYLMRFKGAIVVRAENEDEAEQLFDDAHYGLTTVFDNTDEMEVYAFQYDRTSIMEIYE